MSPSAPDERSRAPGGSPTVRRWELASRLRELRQASNMTIDEVARRLMVSPAKISRIETNERMPQPRDIRDLAILYGLDETQTGDLMDLVRGAKERAWWQSATSDLPQLIQTYIGLESAAVRIRDVDGLRVNGLLQTIPYARALTRYQGQYRNVPDVREDLIVSARQRRQLRLTEAPVVELHSVITQAALAFAVGSAAVMAEQVEHLLAVSQLPTVTLQVVPFSAGATPALHGAFSILGFERENMADVVVVEGLTGLQFFDKATDVAQYAKNFDTTEAAALSTGDSRDLLAEAGRTWRAAAGEPQLREG